MASTTTKKQLPSVLYIPDTLADWPWPRAINPYFEEVKAESRAWFKSFNAFKKPASQLAFDKIDSERLAALAYPWVSKEHLRTGCDLMNFFFLIDEYTDVEPAHVVREQVDIIIDALHNPHKPRPEGEVVLGESARQFWELAIKTATPSAQKHFVDSFTDYLNSLVRQAAFRDDDKNLTIDEYITNRLHNIAAWPAYVPMRLGWEMPEEVYNHPIVDELSRCAAILIILGNDMTSFNKEQATDDDRHNILTVAMNQLDTDYDGAMLWLVGYHTSIEQRFHTALRSLPSFGPEIDEPLKTYTLGLANWPRASECWNFESGRYFGTKGLEYQRTRLVPLLPKVAKFREQDLHEEDIVIPLIEQMEQSAPVNVAAHA